MVLKCLDERGAGVPLNERAILANNGPAGAFVYSGLKNNNFPMRNNREKGRRRVFVIYID